MDWPVNCLLSFSSPLVSIMRLWLIMYGVEVENRADEHGEREDDDEATDDAVDNLNAIHVELSPHFIYQPCQAVPPKQGTGNDAQVA